MMRANPPKHLSRTAKALWREITGEYDLSDAAGLKILQTALEAMDRADAARVTIERDGMTVSDKFGQIKPHPLLPTERDARSSFLQAMKALCLDLEPVQRPGRPSGRGK